jgi:hypothetical protein
MKNMKNIVQTQGPPEWCEVRRRVLYKICKKCISRASATRRARAMRGTL